MAFCPDSFQLFSVLGSPRPDDWQQHAGQRGERSEPMASPGMLVPGRMGGYKDKKVFIYFPPLLRTTGTVGSLAFASVPKSVAAGYDREGEGLFIGSAMASIPSLDYWWRTPLYVDMGLHPLQGMLLEGFRGNG